MFILVYDLDTAYVATLFQSILLDIKPLEHKAQNWLTFALARTVETTVAAHLTGWGFAHPELGYSNGSQGVEIGILQQFGRSTLPCSAWRNYAGVFGKDIKQALFTTISIEHLELLEKPALQSRRTTLAFLFHYHDRCLEWSNSLFTFGNLLLPPCSGTFKLGLTELTFSYQCSLFIGCERTCCTQFATALLAKSHILAHGRKLQFHRMLHISDGSNCSNVFIAALHLLDSPVEGRDFCLFLFEITAWRLQIEHWRNKTGNIIAACKKPREGCQITERAITVANDKDTEHLAPCSIGSYRAVTQQRGTHLIGSHHAKCMRHIVKRVVEALWRFNNRYI